MLSIKSGMAGLCLGTAAFGRDAIPSQAAIVGVNDEIGGVLGRGVPGGTIQDGCNATRDLDNSVDRLH